MCGIMGIHFKNPRDMGLSHDQLECIVDELLLGIEPRGTHATGLLVVDRKNKPFLEKADVKASTFVKFRTTLPKRVRTILGHTRFATQGEPHILENNHPIQYNSCYAIHNGHINNDSELFAEHSLDRIAQVDSEIIPALFDKYGLDKAHLALQELDGGYATAVVDPERFPGVTVLAKGWASPVEYVETKYALVWASTQSALSDACYVAMGFRPKPNRIQHLDPGELLYADGDKIEKLTFKPKAKVYKTTTYTSSWSGGGYYRSPTTDEMYTKCKSCGHSRIHHGSGTDYDGACHLTEANDSTQFTCRCIGFVQPVSETPVGVEFCDDCGREFAMGQLIKVDNGKHFYCKWCLPEVNGPTATELRGRAEAVMNRMNEVAAEFNVEPWDQLVEDTRYEEIHAHVCQMAAAKTHMSAAFVDWLMAKADKDVIAGDSSGYLAKCHGEAKLAYDKAEEELRWEVVDLEIAQYTDQSCEARAEEQERAEYEDGTVFVAEADGTVVSLEEYRAGQLAAEEAEEEVIA